MPEELTLDFSDGEENRIRESPYLQARWHVWEAWESKLVSDYLAGAKPSLLKTFGLKKLASRHLLQLSNGEFRKARLARALLKEPTAIHLIEPYAGLDSPSRASLKKLFATFKRQGLKLRITEAKHSTKHQTFKLPKALQGAQKAALPLIQIKNLKIAYDGLTVFNKFNWTIKPGERWLLRGPNGSGKSTLLSLISADHPQAYSNDITLLGRKRGSGESIWDIKAKIGTLSPELHAQFPSELSLEDTLLSGFYDSLGLFRRPSEKQRKAATAWLKALGLKQTDALLKSLGYAEQRQLLLARAMIKKPALLLLDEVCQGLDAPGKARLLGMIDAVCVKGGPALVFVTHELDEVPKKPNKKLILKQKRPR